MGRRYGWNVLIALDQLSNVLFGPLLNLALRPAVARFGDPDETLSSVFGKNAQAGQCRGCQLICRVLGWISPNHCQRSIENDEGDNALS